MHNDVDSAGRSFTASIRHVFIELLLGGPLSRAELARRVGLSPASLTKIIRPLVDAGHVREGVAAPDGAAGRPSQPLEVNEDFVHVVGVKLTGERLYAVTTNVRGEIKAEHEAPIVDQSAEVVAQLIADTVAMLRADDDLIARIGISVSGNASREEPTIRRSPFLHWEGVPLATMVTELTDLPVVLENDVRALTAAEQWFGAAHDLDSFVLVTFGAGIGCGMVANGAQIDGRLGASGLIGHLPVEDRGPICYAGHRGCAHAYATTTGLVKTVSAGHGLPMLTFEECVELARQGDQVSLTAFQEAGRAIGQLIAITVNVLGPDKVLISGEGAELFTIGEAAARERLAELLHWTAAAPVIEVLPFGFSEWARGAAVVAIQEHVRSISTIGVEQ